jgi:ATP-dependent DNA helicase PIF1
LLRIGDGEETNINIKINDELEDDLIQVQDEMICKSKNLDDFIDEVYPELSNIVNDSTYVVERAILTPKNEDVDIINNKVLSKIEGKEFVYYSADSIINPPSDAYNVIPVEYLNSLTLSGIPPKAN